MFEAGMELKQKFGAENVFDYSLGNPDLPPPPEVKTALAAIAAAPAREMNVRLFIVCSFRGNQG